MKFFNIDLHIGVISDIKELLQAKGHEVVDWTLSAHSWVLGRERDPIKIIDHTNWRFIDQEMADKFYEYYKDELSVFDAFIVTHTPCFAMLYERWGKPIITVASTRYEHPFSDDPVRWRSFNEFLTRAIDNRLVIPVANSLYDARYAEAFTHRKWQVIPSICNYTKTSYQPVKDQALVFSKSPVLLDRRHFTSRNSLKPGRVRRLLNKIPGFPKHRGFSWTDIGKYKGVVHFPYNASIMSIFEQYTANIPMFFPSASFAKSLRRENKFGVFSELSFNQVYDLGNRSAIPVAKPDPNNYQSPDELDTWIDLSDFYDEQNMPFIQYFSSLDELEARKRTTDYSRISSNMKAHNLQRRQRSLDLWEGVLYEISLRTQARHIHR